MQVNSVNWKVFVHIGFVTMTGVVLSLHQSWKDI